MQVLSRHVCGTSVECARLSGGEPEALELVGRGLAQRVVAMKLGLAPSTASLVTPRQAREPRSSRGARSGMAIRIRT